MREKAVLIDLLKDDKRRLQDLWYAPQREVNKEVLRELYSQMDEVMEEEEDGEEEDERATRYDKPEDTSGCRPWRRG